MTGRRAALALGSGVAALAWMAAQPGAPVGPAPAPDAAVETRGERAALPAEPTVSRPRSAAEGTEPPATDEAAMRALREVGLDGASPTLALLDQQIDSLPRDELVRVLSELTGLDRDRLDAHRNLRDYARSLARIALAGLVAPAVDTPSQHIAFAPRLAEARAGATSQAHDSRQPRMFGVFPVEPGADAELLVKWYRVDPPELLMFEVVPVREQSGQAFIRLDRDEGWPEAEYRLEVYATVGDPTLLASGSFVTSGTARPWQVRFQ